MLKAMVVMQCMDKVPKNGDSFSIDIRAPTQKATCHLLWGSYINRAEMKDKTLHAAMDATQSKSRNETEDRNAGAILLIVRRIRRKSSAAMMFSNIPGQGPRHMEVWRGLMEWVEA